MSIIENGIETYKGCVLELFEENGYQDSDFIAIVYDENTDELKHINYNTTRFSGGGIAEIDATNDIIKKAQRKMYKFHKSFIEDKYVKEAFKPDKGKMVCVEKGRKHKGKEGEIFWIGIDKFKTNYMQTYYNVGIKNKEETFFVPIEYVKVIDAADWFDTTPLEIKKIAASMAISGSYRTFH